MSFGILPCNCGVLWQPNDPRSCRNLCRGRQGADGPMISRSSPCGAEEFRNFSPARSARTKVRDNVQKSKSLADYATKRFRLAGKAYLEQHNPFFVPVDKARAEAEARGARFVSFANYDYLGLSNHLEVKAAAHDAIDKIGIGALASRLVGGERSSHHDLEKALADFIGVEEVMTLVSGYLTNVTVISHIMGSRDAIFLDELSQNSIVSGCKSPPAETIFFRHNDLDHLDQLLT